ncbi:phenylacetate--CoA ligase family protein [Rhizorhabdus argentea]|uniref:hypothetical protein n=1 Tax=Rhizorhabdus argentea TaxID=1387174 RepID=UPI0030EEBC74
MSNASSNRSAEHLAAIRNDPKAIYDIPTEELFAIEWEDLEALQLELAQRQFRALRPRIAVLDRLATEVGVDQIATIDDLVPLGLPHTFYKSYSAGDIKKKRFDGLTSWLASLSAYDLSQIDVDGCANVEEWLLRIEAATPMRPVSSSGTSGKISFVPRGIPEDVAQVAMFVRFFEPYGDEYGIDIRKGDVPFLCPWPSDSGRQAFINTIDNLRKSHYASHPELIKTVGQGRITADELLLASKVSRAESLGEELILDEDEASIAERVAARNRAMPDRVDRYVDDVLAKMAGRKVVLFGFWTQLYQLAVACKAKGIVIDWSPDSFVVSGGGTKGFVFPDGWRDVIAEVFPYPLREVYGMSETTAGGVCCSNGHIHTLQWGIKHVVDPESGVPLPRTGVQTGRLLVHDLMAESMWPTTLTGDLVTINFDGGCGCGRKGPYLLNNIQRLSEAQGGDDKITCAKTPQAYERLEAFALGELS